ncbi:MAG: hypothetical protein JW984_07030 [Deltaproteobacteria bacterium]|uniref:Uncharacterized protein n=1 Tax=Candidatus Zymogenus saltonus TaxID=2844893 RepID=A0A9D8KDE6_9DELT|nr:hypothetical protein [Candidatus Zymogenus saltonus]
MKKVNFIVKTKDAKAGDITKALKDVKIDVLSVALVYTEDVADDEVESSEE